MTVSYSHERIIRAVEKCFVTGDDGFVFFWPDEHGGGFSSYDLRTIATELDIRNIEWNKQIADYFEKELNEN